LAAVTGVVALALGVAMWRLSAGPVSLALLAPYVEEALSDEDATYRVFLDDVILTWAGWERTLDIRAIGVRAFSADGMVLAQVPEMAVVLSVPALARGMIAPTHLDLFAVTLRLVRRADGWIELGLGDDQDSGDVMVESLLGDLLAPPNPDREMGYMQRVTVLGARVIVTDEQLEAVWQAPSADIVLERGGRGIEAELDLILSLGESEIAVEATASHDRATGVIEAAARFSDFDPSSLARMTPRLSDLAEIRLPIAGEIGFEIGIDGQLRDARFDIDGGPGTVVIPDFMPGDPVYEIQRITARGRFAGDLRLDELAIDYGGPLVTVSGRFKGDWNQPDAVAEISVTNLPVSAVPRFWRPDIAPGGRRWALERIHDGLIPKLEMKIDLRPEDWDKSLLDRTAVVGEFSFEDGVVEYLTGLPLAEVARARGRFDAVDLHLEIQSARVGDVAVGAGTIDLTELDRADEIGRIAVSISGPLEESLRIMALPRLGFTQQLAIDPDHVSGQVVAEMTISLPLLEDISLEQMEIGATAELDNVTLAAAMLPPLLDGIEATDGKASMVLDKQGFDLSGRLSLGRVPVDVAWREHFDPGEGAARRELWVSGQLFDRDLARLGFGDDIVSGALAVSFEFLDTGGPNASGVVSVDGTAASVGLPALGWSKSVGSPATASVQLELVDQSVARISAFEAEAEDLSIRGRAELTSDGAGLEALTFERFRIGETGLAGALTIRPDGSLDVGLAGGVVDLSAIGADESRTMAAPIMISGVLDTVILSDRITAHDVTGWTLIRPDGVYEIDVKGQTLDLRDYFAANETEPMSVADEAWTLPPTMLSGTMHRVLIDDQLTIKDLRGEARYDGVRLTSARLAAVVGDTQRVDFALDPAAAGRRVLLTSDNAGAVFRALDLTDNMIGGGLRLDAVIHDDEQGGPMVGELMVDRFHVVDAPLLAKLLSIASLTGALEMLDGQGLPFDKLQAPFVYRNGGLVFDQARANGLSLGLTLNGSVELNSQIADLDGTIVPAYLLNSALGNIPVIGELFTGGEGQGIFAATYSVRGPIDDAEITVNPLAALAPGILRDVFLIFDRAPAAEAVPAEAAGQQLDGIGGSPSNDSLETLNGVAGPTGRSNISR